MTNLIATIAMFVPNLFGALAANLVGLIQKLFGGASIES